MASGPSQEKAKVREQIERVINDLLQHFPNILKKAKDGAAAVGCAGAGGAGSFAALYFAGINGLSAVGITSGLATVGGIVGGGMVAGIGILALPVAAGGLAGLALVSLHHGEYAQSELRGVARAHVERFPRVQVGVAGRESHILGRGYT